jgi:hypothetical protein
VDVESIQSDGHRLQGAQFGDVVALVLNPTHGRPGPLATGGIVDISAALAFLKKLGPDDRHNLVTIREVAGQPQSVISGRTFEPHDWDGVAAWLSGVPAGANVYYSVNEPAAGAPHGKLRKEHIGRVRAVFVDIDPSADAQTIDGRATVLQRAEALRAAPEAPPSVIIDSGRGVQALWLLSDRPPSAETAAAAEATGRAAAHLAGGDAVQNVDRILRLPGTANYPDAKKRAKGWGVSRASVLHAAEHLYTLAELAAAFPPLETAARDHDEADAKIRQTVELFRTVVLEDDDGGPSLEERLGQARRASPQFDALWRCDPEGLLGADRSGSGWLFSLSRRMGRLGFDAVDFARAALMWDNPAVDPDKRGVDTYVGRRALARAWVNGGAEEAREAERREPTYWLEPESEPLFPPSAPATAATVQPFDFDAATRLTLDNLSNLPPKRFTLGTRFQPGAVTLGIGPGGVSKSMFAMLSAVSIATGLALTDEIVSVSGPVLVYDAETPIAEMRRRLKALTAMHRVPLDIVLERVRLLSGYDQRRLVLAERRERQGGQIAPSADLATLTTFVRRAGIVHVVLDPLVSLHRGLDENASGDMERLTDLIRSMVQTTDVSLDLIHHSVKNRTGQPEGAAGLADAARGSSAVLAAVRSAYTLVRMSQTTGEELGLPPDRVSQLVRLDDAKRNNTRQSAKRRWFEIQSVLPNGEIVPGWHFEAADMQLRTRALESVGVHVRFDEQHHKMVAQITAASSRDDRVAGVRSFVAASMNGATAERSSLVAAMRQTSDAGETSTRQAIDDAIPEGRRRAVVVEVDGQAYRVWREQERGRGGRVWVVHREPTGQIVPPRAGPVGINALVDADAEVLQ